MLLMNTTNNLSILEWKQLQNNETTDNYLERLQQYQNEIVTKTKIQIYRAEDIKEQWKLLQDSNIKNSSLYGIPCCIGGKYESDIKEINELKLLFQKLGAIVLTETLGDSSTLQINGLVPFSIEINAKNIAKNLKNFCLKLTSNDDKSIFICAQNICDIELVHSLLPTYDLSKFFDSNIKFAIPDDDTNLFETDTVTFDNIVKTINDLGIVIIDRNFNDFYQLIQCLYEKDEIITEKYTKLKQLIRKRSEYLEPTVLEILSRAEETRSDMNEFTDYLRKDVLQSFENKLNGFILPNWCQLNNIDLPILTFPAQNNFIISLVASKFYERGLIDMVKRYLTIIGKLETEKIFIFNDDRTNASFDKIKNFETIAIKTNSSIVKNIRNMGGIFRNMAKLSNKYGFKQLNGTYEIDAACIQSKTSKNNECTVEIWNISKDELRNLESYINNIQNLTIDNVELENGEIVKSFLLKQVTATIKKPFNCVLVANRGEIAVRIIRTLKRLSIKSIAVYSEIDQYSPHVEMADESVCLIGNSVSDTYLNIEQIINIAKQHNVEAIIPGYGFLSENSHFADACVEANIVFVGPSSKTINDLGLKHTAKEIARKAGVPLVPGSDLLNSLNEAIEIAEKIQYPVMIKSSAGGGGIGIMKCNDRNELISGYDTVKKLSLSYFVNDAIYLEKFIDESRHIEVQIFGDGNGNVIALGERDCSLQRRNQKVIEETPAPNISNEVRKRIHEAAINLGKVTKYKCAGTVEFIYEPKSEQFYFLEVNTRLQVEHPVTEEVTGLDLVEWMLLIAADIPPNFKEPVTNTGASIEVRLYAENPVKNFVPSPGQLTEVKFPKNVRVDTWISKGTIVSTDFDPLLAKIIVHGRDRSDALQKLQRSLNETQVYGITTNIDYLRSIVNSNMFASASMTTRILNTYLYVPRAIEILSPGSYTTVQDYPGRVNYWRIGVPPSGPMDNYAFRIANRIVGNNSKAPALEITIIGPTILFYSPTVIALTGGATNALLDDKPIELWSPVLVQAGQKLSVGKLASGCRSYLAIRGGLDVPEFLGSRSTFALGNTGGFNGRTLKFGDVIFMGNFMNELVQPEYVNKNLIPNYGNRWEVGVLYGPHGSPDFFQEDSLKTFLDSEWKVHYNSNRFGVRLIGPKPTWAREDGGEAGLHPSNTHDYVYALGAINFTGDDPVILTCDGPSLGGFVCPFTVADAEMWKVGQVKPGDLIRFRMINFDQAISLRRYQENIIETLNGEVKETLESVNNDDAVLHITKETATDLRITYRQSGDRCILVEYGDNVFDIQITYRIYKLKEIVEKEHFPEIIEMSPGVRSMLIEFDNNLVSNRKMVQILVELESKTINSSDWTVPSRILRLPMAFEDDVTLAAVQRYRETIRSEAPWLPNNVDFITKINRLKDRDVVRNMLYEATFLVLGLGDVFLGAPCAVPLDPRHRLLGSKYNPSRSFTPNGTVGIGGMYMCIYTMESPGGYQLVGRTLPIWDKLTLSREQPWLLTIFDQIQFYPVTQEQLALLTKEVEHGRYKFEMTETIFNYSEYSNWLKQNAREIESHNKKLQEGNDEIVELLKVANTWSTSKSECDSVKHEEFDDSHTFVYCDFVGRVWKQLVTVGDDVDVNQPLVIIEAMKAEMTVTASVTGKVVKLLVKNGDFIDAGDIIAIIK